MKFCRSKFIRPLLALVCLGGGGVCAGDAPLRVSAASSLADALKEIHVGYTKTTGQPVALNLGASSLLARQIAEGAPCDVFLSADTATMDGLEQKGLLLAGTRKAFLSNSLVLVVPSESKLTLKSVQDLTQTEITRIATGNPGSVPVGVYAKAHLEQLGLWSAVAPKVLACENVRAALAAVESGNVEVGIVYKTDASISKQVKVAYAIPAQTGPKIVYPRAVLKDCKQPLRAGKYLEFLDAPAARAVFVKYGFLIPSEADAKP